MANLRKNILDKGFIQVIGYLGSDVIPVNAARVSFGGSITELRKRDLKLMDFLAKHKHHSPFRHQTVCLNVKAPEFVMRQWYKHVVGAETTSNSFVKDHAWNEISGRYVPVAEYYEPVIFRKQSKDNKQASEGQIEDQEEALKLWRDTDRLLKESYQKLLDMGVAKEQARCILPLNQYTEVYWTASFQAIANFIELRDKPDSQWEIRQYAIALYEIIEELYPHTTKSWFENS